MTSPDNQPIIELEDLHFFYGPHHAVRGVSLAIEPGQVFALLGTNGAGKTTTLEMIQGFRRPTRGTVRLLGVDPRKNLALVRARTGGMLQEAGLFPELTVRQTLQLWSDLATRADDLNAVIDKVGLSHKARTRVQSLSGGERRRLDLAVTIWGGPELIVLDEPTTGLDPASRQTLWSLVRELRDTGTTVLLTTHQLEEAESLADHVAIMHQGRLAVAGSLDEVLATQPARVTFDVVPTTGASWLTGADLPSGIEVSTRDVRRPHGERLAVEVTGPSQIRDLCAVLENALRHGVELERFRANPASLEEVFHQARLRDDDSLGDEPQHPSTTRQKEVSA